MDEWRVFGNNVRNLLQNDKTEEAFCQKLGYSPIDVAKLKEGSLLLRTDAIDNISDFLDKPREFLFEEHVANDPVHCMGLFDDGEEDQVLDFFDMYSDLAEAVKN